MSTDVTMRELEFETAELLPARETLSCGNYGHRSSSITNVVGNTSQVGLVNVSAFNGEGNSLNILSGIL
jgi:hypothetical protein